MHRPFAAGRLIARGRATRAVRRTESEVGAYGGLSLRPSRQEASAVIVLGIILLILGFIFSINILWVIGIILVIVGVVLWLLGAMGRAVGGRRHYW
jgi:hypothetical protein